MSEKTEILDMIRDVLDAEVSGVLDFIDVLEAAEEYIEAQGEPTEKPRAKPIPAPTPSTPPEACPYCDGPAAILRVNQDGQPVHIGCSQAFLKPMVAHDVCEKPPAMMGATSEEVAIGQWNAWVAGRRVFLNS